MAKYRIFLDSFSGAAADLEKGHRTPDDILMALRNDRRVSTFDMSEHRWLWEGIEQLKRDGRIKELQEPYPWHRYVILEKADEK